MVHRVRALALGLLAAVAIATPATAGASTLRTAESLHGARSVLVISLPATAWIAHSPRGSRSTTIASAPSNTPRRLVAKPAVHH